MLSCYPLRFLINVLITHLHSPSSPHVLICTLFSNAAANQRIWTRADYKENLDLYLQFHLHHSRHNIELSTSHFRYGHVKKTWTKVSWLAESLSVSQENLLHGIGCRNRLNNLRCVGDQSDMTPYGLWDMTPNGLSDMTPYGL